MIYKYKMNYQIFVEKAKKTLESLVEHSEAKVELMKQVGSRSAVWFVTPELYIMKGLREGVMLIIDPYGRLQKWIDYYKK